MTTIPTIISRPIVYRVVPRLVLIVGILAGFLTFRPTPTHAATLTVTSLNDSGAGSLRVAISNAGSGDTINFSVSGTITLTTGQLTINTNLTIDGTGQAITISGNNANRVFCVPGSTTLTLNLLTISGGSPHSGCAGDGSDGGGIYNSGTLTVTNSTISGNSAYTGRGGGIYNSGTLTVTNSTISGNSAYAGRGGGIYNSGTLTVTNSTLYNNQTSYGGGIYNSARLTVTNSTLYNNQASYGGGIYNGDTLTVINSTLSGNDADLRGGGVYVLIYSTFNLQNTIIAGNRSDTSPDILGPVNSLGHNLIGNTSGVSGLAGDIKGVGANLGALANNGGPTKTLALLPGSPAIDSGLDSACAASPVNNLDQRGFIRPAGSQCDIGAYESGAVPPATPTPPAPTSTPTALSAAPAVMPTTCLTLGYIPNDKVRLFTGTDSTTGAVPVVICYALLTDPSQVGMTQPFSLAVDVLAFTTANTSIAPLTQPVQVCLQGSGSLLFRDATGSPRVTTAISATSSGGYTCGSIPNAGTVILIAGAAAPAGNVSGGTAVASHPLTGCLVTTLFGLNLHSAPNGSIVGAGVPPGVTLSATARAGDWVQVTYGAVSGWLLIPNDLSLSLNCN